MEPRPALPKSITSSTGLLTATKTAWPRCGILMKARARLRRRDRARLYGSAREQSSLGRVQRTARVPSGRLRCASVRRRQWLRDCNQRQRFEFISVHGHRVVRTSNTNNVVQGIVSKYADVSGNGWTLIVQNNHLRGFYYRNNSFSDVAIDATSTAAVADGAWHHAALTVNTNGGTLFLDGAITGQSSWVGAICATTSTQPLQVGRYYNGHAAVSGRH